ncbi:metalloregulator ArsR/SmtB family transcription factor [Pseudoxanthomonas sangjuensis]|uniref:autorepressor SdpR family transcription factor n=1 Tax=Pseudoxanthomonas sangjuensis TaxID=1503750 RepID=UPI0013913A77|nr:autorepressor SdpR family transcription factor [Pseudoxanthomonas sangjuensis]KAF1714843.1 ArsR family transcriptional regulator [Pseudoxanthomonas sangjuensis]
MNAVFKALADPTRRKVLELLRQRPMTAGELADHFPVSRPTMSAHFAVLREADLIEACKIGTTITYQLRLSVLEDALLGFAQLFGVRAETKAPADAAENTEPRQIQEGAVK